MNVERKRRLRSIALLALAAGIAVAAPGIHAADVPSGAPDAAARSSPTASMLKPARPYWLELTLPQRQALAPLSDDWERLDVQTKKKWVEIANRYPKMSPDEQERSQQRMREWALLTPDQRRVARDSFARVRSMNPEQRAEMLRKYRELPDEKRQALATEGHASKGIVIPKALPAPIPQRGQIREGAGVRNPAVAAQKGANPIVAPARTTAASKPAAPTAGPDPAPAPSPSATPEAVVPAPTPPQPPQPLPSTP